MKNMLRKVFGEKLENEIYHNREAAYVVVIDDDKIAVVKISSGKLFLPGGKIESGESLEDCVMCECLEEMGAKVILKEYFAIGERYFYHSHHRWAVEYALENIRKQD